MRKLKLYIATSLNGKIAASDGSVDWLESIPKPENSDYGYKKFYDAADFRQSYPDGRMASDPSVASPEDGKRFVDLCVPAVKKDYLEFTG